MSDELRTWLEEAQERWNDANDDGEVMRKRAYWAYDYGDALLAKVEELAEAFGDVPGLLREIADNARNGNAGEMERLVCTAAYLEDTADFLDAALRAPGGGES